MATDGATPRGLIDLPADVVGLKILYRLTLAHEIAKTAPTCRLLDNAARIALKARPFSNAVVRLKFGEKEGGDWDMCCVAATSDGRVVTCSVRGFVRFWRDGVMTSTGSFHDR